MEPNLLSRSPLGRDGELVQNPLLLEEALLLPLLQPLDQLLPHQVGPVDRDESYCVSHVFFFDGEFVGEDLGVEGVEFELLGRGDRFGAEEEPEGVVVVLGVRWRREIVGGRKGFVDDSFGRVGF